MHCPNGHTIMPPQRTVCPECGEVFETARAAQSERLTFLINWLTDRQAELPVHAQGQVLLTLAEAELAIHLEPPPSPSAPPPSPEPEAVAPIVETTKTAELPLPIPAPRAAPRRPAPPPINWGKVWQQAVDFVASGMLLRALLSLGAFMVVAAALVLVIRFWTTFPALVQVAFIFTMPLAFYGGGFFLRTRLKIATAGAVFTAIGALLTAVDFAAVYQLLNLSAYIGVWTYWLVAATMCLALYVFTAWRLPFTLFGLLVCLAWTNVWVALMAVLGLGLEWWAAAASLACASLLPLALSRQTSPVEWAGVTQAARRYPEWGLPVAMGVGLLVARTLDPHHPAALVVVFVAALFCYLALAWRFPAGRQGWMAGGAGLGLLWSTLTTAALPAAWWPTVAAAAALVYLGIGRALRRGLATADAQPHLSYRRAAFTFGLSLLTLASLLPWLAPRGWGAVAALTVATLGWALAAGWVAPVLVGAAVTASAAAWITLLGLLQPSMGQWALALAGAAAAYTGLGRWGLDRLHAAPLQRFSRCTLYLAGVATMTSATGLGVMNAVFFSDTWLTPAVLAAITLEWAAGAWLFRRASLAWVTASLMPVAFGVALSWVRLPDEWVPLACAMLAVFGHWPVGLLVRRQARLSSQQQKRLAYPFAVVGYGVGVLMCWSVMTARPEMDWSMAVPWLVLAQMLAARGFGFWPRLFAWTALTILPLALWRTLVALGLPDDRWLVVMAGLGVAYILGQRLVAARSAGRPFAAHLASGLGGGAFLLGGGVWAVASPTFLVLMAQVWRLERPLAAVSITTPVWIVSAALGLVAVQTMLAARLHRATGPLFATPWVSAMALSLWLPDDGPGWLAGPRVHVLLWAALAAGFVAAAAWLDRYPRRYASAWYAGGYGLMVLAVALALADPALLVWTGGLALMIGAGSAVWVHLGRHATWDAVLIRFFADRTHWLARQARLAFLWGTAWALPAWLTLTLWQANVAGGMLWLGLSVGALGLMGLARWMKQLDHDTIWPLHSAAQLHTALAVLISLPFTGRGLLFGAPADPDASFQLAALGYGLVQVLGVVFYGAATRVLRQPVFAAVAAGLAVIPVSLAWRLMMADAPLVTLAYPWIGLAIALVLLGQCLPVREAIGLYLVGYGLTAVAVLWAIPQPEALTHVLGLALSVALWSHIRVAGGRHPVWEALVMLLTGGQSTLVARGLRTAFWLVCVAVFPIWLALALHRLGLDGPWIGVALLGLAGAYGIGELGLVRVEGRWRDRLMLPLPGLAATPWVLVLGAGLAVGDRSAAGWGALTAVATAGGLCLTAAWVRRARWLYPALLAAHLALWLFLTTLAGGEARYAALPYHALTWGVVLAGLILERQTGQAQGTALARLVRPTWAQPCWVFAGVDVVVWQCVALGGPDTMLSLAVGHLALFAIVATYWRERWLAVGAIGFALLSGAAVAWQFHLSLEATIALFAGLALTLYLAGWGAEAGRRLAIWRRPLRLTAFALSGLTALLAIGTAYLRPSMAAVTLGAGGLLYLTEAVRRRNYRLGYAGVGLLMAAWVVLLVDRQITQPQFYAAPAGLYLVGIGALERRQGQRGLARLIELLGLLVLMLTSFIQSLSTADGADWVYVALLVVEGLAAMYWGGAQRSKAPFFVGIAAILLNVSAQVVTAFAGGSTVIRWLIIGGAGLLLAGLAVVVEHQRNRLTAQARAFATELEQWD